MAAAGNAAAAVAVTGFPGPPAVSTAAVIDPLTHLGGVLVNEIGSSRVPTPFLCVAGMITPDVLESNEEYEEVWLGAGCMGIGCKGWFAAYSVLGGKKAVYIG